MSKYKALHKSGIMFFVRAACVNRDKCGKIVGHFAGRTDEVSIPFNELDGIDSKTYHEIGTIICPDCQPLCEHHSYCDSFSNCKFVSDMPKCDCAQKGVLIGTCTCKAEHVTIFLVKEGEDFKKDRQGNYIRDCPKCNSNITPKEGAADKIKRAIKIAQRREGQVA